MDELVSEAENSLHGESFKTIQSTDKIRIGAGYRKESSIFFVEVVFKTCIGVVNPVEIHILGTTLEKLQKQGYSLSCEGDSYYAVKNTPREGLIQELEHIKRVIA